MILFDKDNRAAMTMTMAAFFSIISLLSAPLSGQTLNTLDQEVSEIVDRAGPAVVTIEARSETTPEQLIPRRETNYNQVVHSVVGTGLIIDSTGHIVTTLALVDGQNEFWAKIEGKNYQASLIGIDKLSELAVLKVDGIFREYLNFSEVPPLIGRLAIAFGRAQGDVPYPSMGIVAGRRDDGTYFLSGTALPGMIGGAVFNISGEFIGLIVSGGIPAKDAANGIWDGIVFIPAINALAAARKIICCGNNEAGWLGISTAAIELVSNEGQVLGDAVIIAEVEPKSPADRAGLRAGDIITHFGHKEVTAETELQRMVAGAGPDSVISLGILRNDSNLSKSIRLEMRPADQGVVRSATATFKINTIKQGDAQREIDSLLYELNRIETRLKYLRKKINSSP